jgi:pyruvate,water dikinase
VRSSATAEDLPEAAFAGQQDSFLNVVDAGALLDAVRRCWTSLWTDRAIAYRERQGSEQQTVKLAVVVQRMVSAEVAGVMFTANPVTGARDEIVIDASPGLGEAVVSGLVTPDHVVLRKRVRGWRVVEWRAGRREVIVRARAGGGTEHVEGVSPADLPVLPDRAFRQLASSGVAIQEQFGAPQDIEWAWSDGKPYILQARPITALPDPPPRANRLQRLVASTFAEMMAVRPYPLDMDNWLPALAGAIEPLFELLGLKWTLLNLFEARDGVVVRLDIRLPHPTWRTILAPFRLLSAILRYDPLHWESDPHLATAKARAGELDSRDVRAASWAELLELARSAMELPRLAAGSVRVRYFPPAAFAATRLRLLLTLLGQAEHLGTLLAGAGNRTLEANRALEDLARSVRSDSDLAVLFATHPLEHLWAALEALPAGRAFLDDLRLFLERYGHRETMLSTTLQPTWKDAPELVLAIVKGFAAHPAKSSGGKATWQAARDEILRHPLLRFTPLRSGFLLLLARAQTLLQIREDTHFYATWAMPLLRRVFLEMGARLVRAGILDAPEDILHLRLEELKEIRSEDALPASLVEALRASMMHRRRERAALDSIPMVDPRLLARPPLEVNALLSGMPGSPGVAEGPARIVRDGFEFDKLRPGDVLVAPHTNPSWTPLFQRAVAVVVDSGSPGSHAAIVAREYGIPAVMSTVTGTQTLQDGELVRVDGSRGAVFRIERGASSSGEVRGE